MDLSTKDRQLSTIRFAATTAAELRQLLTQTQQQPTAVFADGRIVPLVDKVFPFDQLPEAKACMEANEMTGKIVVRIA